MPAGNARKKGENSHRPPRASCFLSLSPLSLFSTKGASRFRTGPSLQAFVVKASQSNPCNAILKDNTQTTKQWENP